MKILFLSHRVPYPPNKGDKIRSFHEIKHFSRYHEIHLLSFCDDPAELDYAKELKNYCRSVTLIPLHFARQRLRAAFSMAGGAPWTVGYYQDPRMKAAVEKKNVSIQFDLLFVYSSSMAPYAFSITNAARILDFVDSDASKWQQYALFKRAPASWLYAYEGRKLARFERNMISIFDASIFVSARETGHMAKKIHFIQNGIDLDYFGQVKSEGKANAIIFTGVMDYFPNVDAVTYFARDIFPAVRSTIPDAEFLIVGSRPISAVQQLGRIPGVTVTGTVADIRPFMAKSKVAVVPMRISQGIQNKILEAMAAGLPVVTTPAAAAGFDSGGDMPVAIAHDAKSIADNIVKFLLEPLPSVQVDACRHYLRQHYDWSSNLSAFDRLFSEIREMHSSSLVVA
jgi:sugar transferase (PEP-CTERM/EpsH1 system associated)